MKTESEFALRHVCHYSVGKKKLTKLLGMFCNDMPTVRETVRGRGLMSLTGVLLVVLELSWKWDWLYNEF